ncbi:hypothetical protein T01_12386 [Trichinella spiralis]|uniref:Uncharacterized protein n=1 Tax=Trichinella spiralis TaxID=6334 RepID=A0A0V0YXR0_TRISP|nr:hypothetical protein T01_12386 [Trichinella spiralis]
METSALFFSNIFAQLLKGNVCHRDTAVAESHP